MRLSESKRLVGITIWFIVLLTLPLHMEIYYRTLYYVGAIFLMPIFFYRIVWDQKFDKKFYKRWDRAREQGFWVNVAREGLRSFVFMTVITMISQFFGYGRTPFEMVLPASILVWIVFLFMLFSLVGGIVAWYENDKRYNRIYYSMDNSKNAN
ncbi:MAG: hypothetical protein P4L69_22805 [Desulfosporosinus sp.]|nr:hypothetical protein [Desulfosporosinus sp.]